MHRLALAASLALLLPGCYGVFHVNIGHSVPTDAQLEQIVLGETTAHEAMAMLGPPEEFRSPGEIDRLRARPRQGIRRRVEEERDLFGRRQLSWVHEKRDADVFRLLPIIPGLPNIILYWWAHEDVRDDRVILLLDENGRVEHIAITRETEP